MCSKFYRRVRVPKSANVYNKYVIPMYKYKQALRNHNTIIEIKKFQVII